MTRRQGAAPRALADHLAVAVRAGRRAQLRRSLRRARQLRDRRPVVGAARGPRRERRRLELVERRRFLAEREVGIAAAAIDAAAAGLAVAVGRGCAFRERKILGIEAAELLTELGELAEAS